MERRSALLWVIMICIPIILAGCFKGEQSMEETDPPPENATGMDDNGNMEEETVGEDEGDAEEADMDGDDQLEGEDTSDDATNETVKRELYLIDADGMVASQTLELPVSETKEVATQALEYLVKGGPVTSILPNGFEAVLPEGTEVALNLEDDGTMIVDVSTEFENYESEDELKILQAMTYTLTQFDGVDRIGLWINGYPQDTMPVDGTPIQKGYSRANGINLINSDTIDLIDSVPVTLFYPATYNDNHYTVPITQHVSVEDGDIYTSMVQALVDGPSYGTEVMHVFNNGTMLASSPSLNDGTLELIFNEDILQDIDEAMISDEVMKSLVLSLTEDEAVDALQVSVENVETLHNENGESYDEPVTKDTFVPSEKL